MMKLGWNISVKKNKHIFFIDHHAEAKVKQNIFWTSTWSIMSFSRMAQVSPRDAGSTFMVEFK